MHTAESWECRVDRLQLEELRGFRGVWKGDSCVSRWHQTHWPVHSGDTVTKDNTERRQHLPGIVCVIIPQGAPACSKHRTWSNCSTHRVLHMGLALDLLPDPVQTCVPGSKNGLQADRAGRGDHRVSSSTCDGFRQIPTKVLLKLAILQPKYPPMDEKTKTPWSIIQL